MKTPSKTVFKDWIGLIVAVVISVLFVVFSTPLYELMYYEPDFANEMYYQNMYIFYALFNILVVWAVVVLYYLIIDNFERWWCWLIALIVCSILAPVLTYYYAEGVFMNLDNPLDFSLQLTILSYITTGLTIVLFVVFSFCIKSLSRNCSTTPF